MATNPSPPLPATILPSEVTALRNAWQQNPTDLGLIVYKPGTGEFHVGSFDAHGGHDLFLHNLLITDDANWRGASISSGGVVINNSGLNVGKGHGQGMPPGEWQEVLQACRDAGLTTQTS
jgi:hypothetical protein